MKLREYFGSAVEGDVGIEIEIEGEVPEITSSKYWQSKPDGSLRGGLEYVTKGAVAIDKVEQALKFLNKIFDKHEAKPSFSFRTSVHVHLNCLDMDWKEIAKFTYLLWIFEPILIELSGERRRGNRFCLTTQQAEVPVDYMLQSFNYHPDQYRYLLHLFNPDFCKYSAINLATLRTFGTIEVRTMEGTIDTARIVSWCKLLHQIKVASLAYSSIQEIESSMDRNGLPTFLEGIAVDTVPKHVINSMLNEITLQRSLLISVAERSRSLYETKDSSVQEGKQSGKASQRYFVPDFPAGVALAQDRETIERLVRQRMEEQRIMLSPVRD